MINKFEKFELKQTCFACPEQYDVFYGGEQVGYLRLRHGSFTCDYPNSGGETVYWSPVRGDGTFYDEMERQYHIKRALMAINEKLEEKEYYDKYWC